MSLHIQQSTLPGGITLLERHYDSQVDLANYVLTSWVASDRRTKEPLWCHNSMTRPDALLSSHILATACNRLHGYSDADCDASMAAVREITRRIVERVGVIPALDVHRKRTVGGSGYALNIHKVNRGQLSTAWKRTTREQRVGNTGVVTLVLCTDYTSSATYAMAQYTIGATLALAQKIEETGRRCEIWASILTHDAHNMRAHIVETCPQHFDELDHLVVKKAAEDLNTPTLAALCSLSLVRGLFFQVWRMQRDSIGPMDNYGCATDKHAVLQRLAPYLTRQGIPLASVQMGADESDYVHNLDTAVAWVSRRLQALLQAPAA
jgi:hypothetical protein